MELMLLDVVPPESGDVLAEVSASQQAVEERLGLLAARPEARQSDFQYQTTWRPASGQSENDVASATALGAGPHLRNRKARPAYYQSSHCRLR